MPGLNTHQLGGGLTGAGFAGFQARHQKTLPLLIEITGGFLGGRFGGRLPDDLEPAISSWHRKFAHSFTVSAGITVVAYRSLSKMQVELRAAARRCEERANGYATDHAMAALWRLAAWFLHFIAGLIAGIVAGYLSHLALDALTPRSIPII